MRREDLSTVLIIVLVWVLSLSVGYLYQSVIIAQRISEAKTTETQNAIADYDRDTQPPRILGIDELQPTIAKSTSFTLSTDEALTPTSDERYSLELIETDSNQYKYLVKVDNLEPGDNRFSIALSDTRGNTNQHQLNVNRIEVPNCWDGSDRAIAATKFPFAMDTVVDKFHKLDSGFYPQDLVNGAYNGIPVYHQGTAYVRVPVLQPLKDMLNAAKADGISVYVSSGYRSFAAQARAHNYWTGIVGGGNANYYAALPGHSEHHLGTTVDLLTSENGYTISDAYENTRLGRWLQQHAHEYGFVMSYPKGKESITGYGYEPWHWRYLGVEHAEKIKEYGLTPTEYLYSINKIDCN